ncbi:glutathione S-transferase [Pseudorhodobacter antarcticus]|jgi:glutathione S-transferase|uniref:Glutathione S-transferase n=1 Tax=Pseudorhodobacter antarcticus TaxID=1077947 RepID=A0A1H8FZM1_9RHOB|nr:glutathione S-transferase [Pseudorhodobacter antarcticus]SEN37186.1 glutathione S-transferase [Pseudorhodobacter antarcticus]
MTYTLAIGDRAYSSWSLRGWLLFDAFGIPVKTQSARLYTDELPAVLAQFVPARTVPVMRCPDGAVVPDSLAMAEELASRHPGAGLLPADPKARAVVRVLMTEMHAGFGALRNYCPMNLRVSYANCAAPQAVLDDLARLETLWDWARAQTGNGAWLCGAYSAADAFYAPVAARIAGYNLGVGTQAQSYVAAHLAHPSFRRWRAMGHADGADQANYFRDYPRRDWPGAGVAGALAKGPSVNTACPYSGDPVTHFMAYGDRVWGFCNAFCRDKTLADPGAWPQFMALYNS